MTKRQTQQSRQRNAAAHFLNRIMRDHELLRRHEYRFNASGREMIRYNLGQATARRLSAERLGWRLP